MAVQIPRRSLFIGGEWRDPVLSRRLPVVNPSTEAIIGEIPAATGEDVELAVESAHRAFVRNGGLGWSRAPGAIQANYLRAIAKKIIERKSDLAKLESLDSGKPLEEAQGDVADVAECFEYYANLAEALDVKRKSHISLPLESFKSHFVKEPIGVVGLITPWNYPLLMAAWKVAPALAAGCTAILKPSELASLTCLELGDICLEVGLPAGVLNIVTGLGHEAGAPLSSHHLVDKIAFTGSTETGRRIVVSAAQIIKPVSLELGGKSPIIIFDDVDFDQAIQWIMYGCFANAGQICSATSRLIIHEKIANKFIERLVNWVGNIKISEPMEEGCKLGPVVSKAQYEKINEFISNAKNEGATVLCGGVRPKHLEKGFFIEPTIVTNVSTYMQIWREEVFGPVLCVMSFRTEEEAIKLANDTHYGLAGAVISNDKERCQRLTEDIEAGIIWINCSQPCFLQTPWGGKKRSGFGRELGEWGLENFLAVKQVTEYISREPWSWYQAPSKL